MQNRKRDTDIQNRLWDSVGEGEGGMFWENSIETSILSSVKQSTSPGWMHETSAQGWCTGKTQRDGMGREAGGGIGMGNTCNPWLIHVNVWQKLLQYCNVISLQLIKINEKKKRTSFRSWTHKFCLYSIGWSLVMYIHTCKGWRELGNIVLILGNHLPSSCGGSFTKGEEEDRY